MVFQQDGVTTGMTRNSTTVVTAGSEYTPRVMNLHSARLRYFRRATCRKLFWSKEVYIYLHGDIHVAEEQLPARASLPD